MIRLSSDPVMSFEESAEKANERTVIAWPKDIYKRSISIEVIDTTRFPETFRLDVYL